MKLIKVTSVFAAIMLSLGILYTYISPFSLDLKSIIESHDSLEHKISKINPLLEKEYNKINRVISEIREEKARSTKNTPSIIKKINKIIQKMVDIDQTLREAASLCTDEHWDIISNIDKKNTAQLKDLLDIAGTSWFTISQFGKACDNNAWLLVQHADLDPAFQTKILVILETLLKTKETSLKNYAYLYDRTAGDTGKLQRYGTQLQLVGDKLQPYPIEDPQNVDKRRQTVGLDSLEKYIKYAEKVYLSK